MFTTFCSVEKKNQNIANLPGPDVKKRNGTVAYPPRLSCSQGVWRYPPLSTG